MTEALLPCPFCGSEAQQRGSITGFNLAPWVSCSKCGADMVGKTLGEAVEKWNRRALPPASPQGPDPVREEMARALEPFEKAFDRARQEHIRRSAEAVKLGRIWFDEMPGDWKCELPAFTMAVFRAVRAALALHRGDKP